MAETSHPMTSTDSTHQAAIRAHVAAARSDLEARMSMAGMTRDSGWEILERVIDSNGGSTWLLLPMHATMTPPGDLSASISVGSDGKIRE